MRTPKSTAPDCASGHGKPQPVRDLRFKMALCADAGIGFARSNELTDSAQNRTIPGSATTLSIRRSEHAIPETGILAGRSTNLAM